MLGRRLLGLLFFVAGCQGEKSLLQTMDDTAFSWAGGTVFSDPGQLTMKELHFDDGKMLGRDVIVEGEIISTGKYYTYLVLSDESGRMLVVLTHLEEAEELLKADTPKVIKVLGTVERGKKGLPYILARSINSVKAG